MCVRCAPVLYLGHVVSVDNVAMDCQKAEAMTLWTHPRFVHALRSFLGLAGYYHRFIWGYRAITTPLTCLLPKDGFSWTEAAKAAFQELKCALLTAPIRQL